MITPWLQDGQKLIAKLEEDDNDEEEEEKRQQQQQQQNKGEKEKQEDREILKTPKTDTKKAVEQEHILQTFAVRFLIKVLFLFEFILALIPVINVIIEVIETGRWRGYMYPITYFLFPFGYSILCFTRCVAKRRCSVHYIAIACCTFWMTVEEVIIFCTFFMSIHHLLWILLGVITEPSWAVPVLAVVCSVCIAIYALAYNNQKAFPGTRCHTPTAVLSALLVIILVVQFVVFGLAGEVFLSTDPVAGIISSLLVFVVSLWFNYFKKKIYRDSRNNLGDKRVDQKLPIPTQNLIEIDIPPITRSKGQESLECSRSSLSSACESQLLKARGHEFQSLNMYSSV